MKMNAIIGIIPINGMVYYVVDDAVEALGYHSTSEAAKLLPAEDTYTLSIHGSVDANMLLLTNLHGLEILIRNSKNPFVFKDTDMIVKRLTPDIPPVPFLENIVKVIPSTVHMQIEFSDTNHGNISDDANKELYTVTEIASEYGWTPRKLNSFLESLKIQWKTNNRWQLSRKYAKRELAVYKYRFSHMQWTAKGKAFIDKLMKENGYEKINTYD